MEKEGNESRAITVMVNKNASVGEVAMRLREMGLQKVQELANIFCVTAEWSGRLSEIKSVDGVDDVEVQRDKYFPT